MSDSPLQDAEAAGRPFFELHFSPRALVRSRLRTAEGEEYETGQKGCEVRWQQGAIAVCILAVYTRLRAAEGASEAPLLEGERGSAARSIDNLLTKPGDWALNMFGERQQMPRIREFIYRKKAVSKSNPVSAVQWDVEQLPMDAIRIWQEGRELTAPEEWRTLLRVLLEEFNPRRVEGEWAALFPSPPLGMAPPLAASALAPATGSASAAAVATQPPFEGGAGAATAPPFPAGSPAEGPVAHRPWLLLLLLFGFLGVGAYFLGRSMGPMERRDLPPVSNPARESAAVVEEFIELLNARALEEAYRLMTPEYREEVPLPAFALALGHQRFNFPRIAGNPYRNRPDQRVHEYRVTLYVETEVHRIPPLEGLARLPVTEIDAYAAGINALVASLVAAGVDPVFLRQLQKDRLERRDASRYLQLVCGLDDAAMAALFPEVVTVTLDLTYFFQLVRNGEAGSGWSIQAVADAADRLVTF
jgi:hypothetical protein